MAAKLTTKKFIERARSRHGDRYDYSLVDYVSDKTDVTIICSVHAAFLQKAGNHLMGKGCADCAGNITLTTEAFISRAKRKHGDKFDYSRVTYVKSDVKVEIICKIHGVFLQSPHNHLCGKGCADCWGGKQSNTAKFIEKARLTHGHDRYDYSLVDYVKSSSKVKILCKKHGEFLQRPNDHLMGKGCSDCAGIKLKTTEQFIAEARNVHHDKYDYSMFGYINALSKGIIICPEHGEFLQTPDNHLHGKGCPHCAQFGYRPSKPGTLYYVSFDLPETTLWKIGITNLTVKQRFETFDVKPTILWQKRWDDGYIAYNLEQSILRDPRYDAYRYKGESLLKSGNTECFTIDIMSLGNARSIIQKAA